LKTNKAPQTKVGDWIDHEREPRRHRVSQLISTENGSRLRTACGRYFYVVSTMVDNAYRSNKGFCGDCSADSLIGDGKELT